MDSPEKNVWKSPGPEVDHLIVDDGDLDKKSLDIRRGRTAAFVRKAVFDLVIGSPVLRCFVASSFDGLLYAGSAITEDLKNKPLIERKKIAERTEKLTKGGYWIPFDVNSIELPTPPSDSRTSSRGDIQREENCQFVINSYDLAPETLVLIPRPLMHLVTKSTQQPNNILPASATRIPRGLAHLAFPTYLLPEALENVRQAAISTGVYVSPHCGHQVPFKPRLFRLSETKYTPTNTISPVPAVRGFSILSEAIQMSQKGKQAYFLDLHPFQPFGCDAIIHGHGEAEWDVETKLRSNIEVGSMLILHYDVDGRGSGDPVAPFGVWSFLMLYDESENFCYWIPRDRLKLEWSPTYLGCLGSGVIRIPKQDVAAFRVDCRHSNWFSHVVNKIILPNKDVPRDLMPSLEQIDKARDNPNLDFVTPDRVEPYSLFIILQAQCAVSRKGLFLVLDADGPAGNYAYIDWTWSDEEVVTFGNKHISPTFYGDGCLAPETLAVPIHVHQVATSDAAQEQGIHLDSVDVSKWRKEKHVFIGDTHLHTTDVHLDTSKWDRSRGIYLIASGECRDEPRATFHRHNSEKLSALLADYLPKNKLPSSYIVSSRDIVPKLQTLMEEYYRSETQPIRFGGAEIIPDDYITIVADLMK